MLYQLSYPATEWNLIYTSSAVFQAETRKKREKSRTNPVEVASCLAFTVLFVASREGTQSSIRYAIDSLRPFFISSATVMEVQLFSLMFGKMTRGEGAQRVRTLFF